MQSMGFDLSEDDVNLLGALASQDGIHGTTWNSKQGFRCLSHHDLTAAAAIGTMSLCVRHLQ